MLRLSDLRLAAEIAARSNDCEFLINPKVAFVHQAPAEFAAAGPISRM